jgi:hypothetical protein
MSFDIFLLTFAILAAALIVSRVFFHAYHAGQKDGHRLGRAEGYPAGYQDGYAAGQPVGQIAERLRVYEVQARVEREITRRAMDESGNEFTQEELDA